MDVELDRARFAHLRGYEGFDIDSAMGLFNRASLYPPAVLVILIASLYLPL